MEGLLEMTFRPSQHNVGFRSVSGSISEGFWEHFREVFGHTSGSEGVLKFSFSFFICKDSNEGSASVKILASKLTLNLTPYKEEVALPFI